MPYKPYLDVVERLCALCPGEFPKKGLLFNSGAEAVENAVKIARSAKGRSAILCFEGAFHGRTLLALSLTSKTDPYKRGFDPFCPDVVRVPYPYCYRCPVGRHPEHCQVECRELLERAVDSYVDSQALAAIVIEPQLGEGGFVPAPAEFLRSVRRLCDRSGAVMIVDEVQTGFGRTGSLFAIEQASVIPDLMVLAKSLAAGFPLSAVVGRAELMDGIQVGGLGGTYGGNPVSCAAALAVLNIIEQEDLPSRAREIGKAVRKRMEKWQRAYPRQIGDLRGLGAMLALELVKDSETREPFPELTKAWVTHSIDQGVLVLSSGVHSNVIRLLVPLTMSDQELNQGLDGMEQALGHAMLKMKEEGT